MLTVTVSPGRMQVGQTAVEARQPGTAFLTELYRRLNIDYSKFFKMDTLCKLGFVASEYLLQAEAETARRAAAPFARSFSPREDRAVVLFNRSGSLATDRRFQATIQDPAAYYPSPSVFVYTLPNIVTGEIAIRNRYYGETSFCVLPDMSPGSLAVMMSQQIGNAFSDAMTVSVLGGWVEVDYRREEDFSAVLFLMDRTDMARPETRETIREKLCAVIP